MAEDSKVHSDKKGKGVNAKFVPWTSSRVVDTTRLEVLMPQLKCMAPSLTPAHFEAPLAEDLERYGI